MTLQAKCPGHSNGSRNGVCSFLRNVLRTRSVNRLAASARHGDPGPVKELAEALVHTPDRATRKTVASALSSLSHPGCIDSFCRYIMEHDAPELQEIALRSGFLPSDPADRALFRFITGQCTTPENTDADSRLHLLTGLFRDTPWNIRERVFSAALQQGMSADLLSVMRSDSTASTLWSSGQWSRLADVLSAEGRTDDLVRVVQNAPLPVSVKTAAALDAGNPPLPAALMRGIRSLHGCIPPAWTWPEPGPLLYRSLAGPGSMIGIFAVSPDGRCLAAGGYDGSVNFWRLPECRLVHTSEEPRNISSMAFSNEGSVLACGCTDGTIRLVVHGTGTSYPTSAGHNGAVRSLLFLPGDRVFLSGGDDGRILLWNTEDGTPAGEQAASGSAVNVLALSPDGMTLATGGTGPGLCAWQVDGAGITLIRKIRTGQVQRMEWSVDGTLLTTCDENGDIRSLAMPSGEYTGSPAFPEKTERVTAVSRGATRAASGDHDGAVRIARLPAGDLISSFRVGRGAITSLCFSPDASVIVCGSRDGSLSFRNADSGEALKDFRAHKGWVRSVAVTPGGTAVVSAGWDDTLAFHGLPDGRRLGLLRSHPASVRCISLSGNGDILACGTGEGTLGIWNLPSRHPPRRFPAYADSVQCIAVSPDGSLVACGGKDGTLNLWSFPACNLEMHLNGHSGSVHAAVFSPDGTVLATGGWDGKVILRRIPGGENTAVLEGHQSAITGLAFTPDGSVLASSSHDRTVRLWDTEKMSLRHVLTGHRHIVHCVAAGNDGRTLASGSRDRTVRLWSLPDGACMHVLSGHTGAVTHLAFRPDCSMLASAGKDHTVTLWSLPGGEQIHTRGGHPGIISGLAITADGKHLLSGSHDGSLRMWNLPWTKPLCRSSPDDLVYLREIHTGDPEPGAVAMQWSFLEKVLMAGLRTSVECCSGGVSPGDHDIEIAGSG